MSSRKACYILVLISTALALCVVILGAYTRLKHAGLGCPDWPGCYGFAFVPETSEQISQAEALFPDAPFEAEKAWPEVIHRYFASLLGFVIILINILAWKNRGKENQPLKLPIFLLFLVILQGMFGMWTVTLKLWPQVVTTHLLGGFTTLSLLTLLTLRLSKHSWPQQVQLYDQWQRLKPLAIIGLVLVVCQIALGGWVSSNYAALACPDLPTCQNQWWPMMDFAKGYNFSQEIGPNYLGGQLEGEGRVAIHIGHRIGAIIVTCYLSFLIWKLHKNGSGKEIKRQTHIITGLLVMQLCLGLSNIIWYLPLWVAVAHNAGGALLLLSMVALNYRLHSKRSENNIISKEHE